MVPRTVKPGTVDARQVAVVVVNHHGARVGVGVLGAVILTIEGT